MEQRNVFAYMRISTKEERKQQKFDRQERALERYAKENGIEYVLVVQEDASGKSFDARKKWNNLERLLKPGDMVVFKDISRFTREALNGFDKYMSLLNRNIDLIFLDNTTVSTPYIKEMLHVAEEQDLVTRISLENTIKLLLIVELDRAEKERTTLVKRTLDGLAATSKKGGRTKGSVAKLSPELREDIVRYLSDRSVTQKSLENKYHISRTTLNKYERLVGEQLKKEGQENASENL